MMRLLAICLLLCAAILSGPVAAQAPQRIAAVVNDDLISFYDLTNRMNLVASDSRIQRTPENVQRLARDVLRTLIDEKLKLQEADRLSATISDEEVQRAFAALADNNNMSPAQLETAMNRDGITIDTLLERFRADFSWLNVQRRLRAEVNISQREIDEELQRLEDQQDRTQWLLGEIFIAVPQGRAEEEVEANMRRLRSLALREGNFPELAKQFSESVTAAVRGDLGWVPEGDLPAEVEAAVREMEPGQISQPIRSLTGFHLMALRDTRSGAMSDPDRTEHDLAVIEIPLSDQPTDEERAGYAELVSSVSDAAEGCDTFLQLARQAEPSRSGLMPGVILTDLAPAMRGAVERLTEGQASGPMPGPDSIIGLMLCDKRTVTDLPSAEEIENQLTQARIAAAAQRKLRDLRRAAFIDVRL